jgi:hypothetical protein
MRTSVAVLLALAFAPPGWMLACRSSHPAAEPPRPASSTGSAASCEQILERSKDSFARAQTAVDRKCSHNEQCVEVKDSCLTNCGGLGIAGADQTRWEQLVADARKECTAFRQADCFSVLSVPAATCFKYVPVCENGRCEDKPMLGGP